MQELSQNISKLLFDYDCVIIPELGGFITNYKSAYLNEDNQVFFPPSKAIGFNANLKNNDGLLANHIARAEHLSFEEANAKIKNQVEDCFEVLNSGKRVVFEKVGILFLDEEKSMQFEPAENVNYLAESFGLFEFHFPKKSSKSEIVRKPEKKEIKIKEVKKTPVISISKEEKVIGPLEIEDPKKPKKSRYLAVAALIPLIFYLGFVTWQSGLVKDGGVHSSDFNPFKLLNKHSYQERSEDFILEEGDDLNIEVFIPTKVEKNEEDPMLSLYANEAIASLPFHIMNGCFSIQANAERQTRRLRKKGHEAFIIDKKGRLWRVSQGSFSDEDEALKLLRKLKSRNYSDAWILKK